MRQAPAAIRFGRPAAPRPTLVLMLFAVLAAVLMIGCASPDGDETGRPITDSALSDSLLIEILADLHVVDARRYLTIRDDSVAGSAAGQSGGALSGQAAGPAAGSRNEPDHEAALLARLGSGESGVDSVLVAHGASREQYDRALGWYVDHPDQFVNLYNRVLDRLNQAPQESVRGQPSEG